MMRRQRKAAEMVETMLYPGVVVGYRNDGRPIYLARGGRGGATIVATDDDDAAEADLDGDGSDDDDDADDDDDEEEAWAPPTRDEWASERAARHAANSQAAARRKLLELVGVKYNRATGEPTDPDYVQRLVAAAEKIRDSDDDDSDGDDPAAGVDIPAAAPAADANGGQPAAKAADPQAVRAAVEKAVKREVARTEARVTSKYKPILAEIAVEAALARYDWSGTSTELAMRMMDMDLIDVHEGRVVGVDEQVAHMKEEFPDLFRGRRSAGNRRRGATSVDGGDKGRRQPPAKRKSWTEQLSARIDGVE